MRAGLCLLRLSAVTALAIGAAAVANPAESSKGCDYAMIVLDGSGSMDANSHPKMAYARQALHEVVPEIAAERSLGLIVYGDPDDGRKAGGELCFAKIALKVRPQAGAAEPILKAVDAVSPQGMTPLTEAVENATHAASDGSPPGTIVLVTDGLENCSGRPCDLGRRLRATRPGLAVHIIGLQFPVGSDTPLGCLAAETGGTIQQVDDALSLAKALRDTLGCPAISDARPLASPKRELAEIWRNAYPNG